jgi:hypothetical protein
MIWSIIAVSVVLLSTMNVLAIQSKAHLMNANGERSSLLLSRIIPYLEKIGKDDQLLLLDPTPDGVEYSVFLMSGFNVLDEGLNRINQLSRRADLRIKVISQSQIEPKQLPHDALILELDRATGDIIRLQ